jgi:hypothetical protein
MNIFAVFSILSAIINLFLGYIVFKKRPGHSLNRVFGLIILACVIWPSSEFILRFTDSQQIAYLAAKIAWAPILLSSALIFHLASILVKADKRIFGIRLIVYPYLISGLFIFLNFSTDWVISGAHLEYWGYTGSFGWAFSNIYSIYHVFIAFVALYMLFQRYELAQNTIERFQIKYVFLGLSVPYILGSFIQIFPPILGLKALPFASLTTIIMDGFIAYAILRYQLMSITPTTEEVVDSEPAFEVGAKISIRHSVDDDVMRIYVDQIKHGRQGLCVTFQDPERIRKDYGIEKTPIIKLDKMAGGESTIKADDLNQLALHLKDFIRISDDRSILFIDGLDRLVFLNDFERTYELISDLNTNRSKTNKSILLSVKDERILSLFTLQMRKDDIEKEIFYAKERMNSMSEENFHAILKDFQQELIELDLKMGKISKSIRGEELEIID